MRSGEANMNDDFDPHKVARQGTAKMVVTLAVVPAVVLLTLWALVRLSSSPEIPEAEVISLACTTADEETTFSGQLDPDSMITRDFDKATLRIEFTGFLVRAVGMQSISIDDVDPETGLIPLEVTEEITGPAICEVASFLEN
jgi:hypothetical protein